VTDHKNFESVRQALKSLGPISVAGLAEAIGLTPESVRVHHLYPLRDAGEAISEQSGPKDPALWRLTPAIVTEHDHEDFEGMQRVAESEASILYECQDDPSHAAVANRCQAQTKAGAQCRSWVSRDNTSYCRLHFGDLP